MDQRINIMINQLRKFSKKNFPNKIKNIGIIFHPSKISYIITSYEIIFFSLYWNELSNVGWIFVNNTFINGASWGYVLWNNYRENV